MNKKLCIVVPYRDRAEHLKEFAPHMKRTLDDQGIDHAVLIVEQEAGKPFNRAKLLNVGFDFTKGEYDYYCFHDVDMLPVESDYSYCLNPTHLASRAEQFGWKLPYNNYFGGVTIFDRESFQKINGYANEFWGWGAEDDDVFNRCVDNGVKTSRKNCSFRSLSHERKIDHGLYHENMRKLQSRDYKDGLRNLKYEVLEEKMMENYKKVLVRI